MMPARKSETRMLKSEPNFKFGISNFGSYRGRSARAIPQSGRHGRDAPDTGNSNLKSRISARRGFTLLEMLTTVAAFVIVLGLMVDLARHVRNESAIDLTKSLLRRLDGLMAEYEAHYHRLPQVAPFIDAKTADPQEPVLQRAALANNRQTLAVLRKEVGATRDDLSGVGTSIYDEAELRDAWGTPIVFMPAMHPLIGMAPQNRRFFFSAGPDRRFLTQEDNLYSYEEANAPPMGEIRNFES